VNGISAILEKGMFDKFMRDYDPQILCLNETKTDIERLDKIRFYDRVKEGYAQYWNCSKKKGYSGTAIFTKVRPLRVDYNFGA